MLHIFTYGAGDLTIFDSLKRSSVLHNLNIKYITNDVWGGYFDKIKYVFEEIKDLPDDDIVCFVDGFDVVACGSETEILDKFLKQECDLLLSAELNSWPQGYVHRYPQDNNNFRYVNAGGFIGYKKNLYELYTFRPFDQIEEVCKRGSDQAYFIEYYLDNKDTKSIKLDSKQEIFQSMFGVDWNEFYISKGRIVNTILETTPCFVHFNGDSCKTSDGGNIMTVFVDKIVLSLEKLEDKYDVSEYKQNFSHFYYKRNQK
jgi:hypothetical protein